MKERLNWAVLGTGVIANQMAQALQKMGKPLYAVGNRTYEKAVAFAEKYGVQKVYSEIDEMFTDENVDHYKSSQYPLCLYEKSTASRQAPFCGEIHHP